MMITWNELDWPALDRLRERFLRGAAAGGPYWESPGDLESYDLTYGERIGWKWDHVLRELRLHAWAPRARTVFDWGCGSGIASRRVIQFFGAPHFESLLLWDHSPLATDFAAGAAQRTFPGLAVAQATPGMLANSTPIGLLLLSHVLSELDAGSVDTLVEFAARAESILWVESGTHEVSRRLGGLRARLCAAGFRVVAPCTHANACPMFIAGNERHWCHFFAPPPGEIFADSNWVKFGRRAGIDLRSLPYSFLALDRCAGSASAGRESPTPSNIPELSRVIGRPGHFKPYVRLLNCDSTGLAPLEISKRTNSPLCKELERTKAPLVYRWRREGTNIIEGEPLSPAPQQP